MSRSGPRLRTIATIFVALVVIAGLVAPAAFAHAQLLRSDPQDGARLPTTDEVVLTFNEDINPEFVQVLVTGPDGPLTLDAAVVDGPLVTQPVTPSASGAHTVSYRVVSADGHPVSGRVGFVLTDVAAPAAAAPTAEAPTTPPPAAEPPTTPEQPTVMSGDGTSGGAAETPVEESATMLSPLAWFGAAAVLAWLVGAGAWAVRRRRHPEH